jgi:hypothetical protein
MTVSSITTAPRQLDVPAREDKAQAAPAEGNASIPSAFTIPRIDAVDKTPAVPPGLDIKNIKRAHNYADAFGMAVDPTKDVSTEGAATLFARYEKQVSNVIDRIMKAKFKALLDVKT